MKAKFASIILPLLIVFGSTSVAFAQSKVRASLNLTEGTVDDQYILTITTEGKPENFDLPSIAGVNVVQKRQASRYSFSWGTGSDGKKSETDFVYYLEAQKPGTYTIPSLTLKIDGSEHTTIPLTFVAHKGQVPTRTSATNDIFIERSFSKKTAYVGEQIVVTNRIFTTKTPHKPQINQPDSPNFKYMPVKGEQIYNKIVDGKSYSVIEFKAILIPQKKGAISMAPIKLEALVEDNSQSGQQQRRRRTPFDDFFNDDFFGGMFGRGANVKQVRVSSAEGNLQFLDVPTQGQPDNFSGLVGQFQLTSDLSHTAAQTGDTVTLEINLMGKGFTAGTENLQPKFDPSLKVYPDQPRSAQKLTDSGYQANQTFKYALVPTKSGEIKVGSVEISYFDPESKSYKTAATTFKTLSASGPSIVNDAPAATGGESSTKQNVEVIANDLLPLHTGAKLTSSQNVSKTAWWIGVVLVLIPWFAGVFYGIRKFASSKKLFTFSRSMTPLTKIKNELNKAQELVRQDETNKGLQLTDKALRQYAEQLSDQNRKQTILGVLRDVEASIYSGKKLASTDAEKIILTTKNLVLNMERDV